MKYVDEFRDIYKAEALEWQIQKLGNLLKKPVKIMEVCGGHTHSIFKYGIEELLPPSVELIHGPGCPVCVMPKGRIDDAISIAQNPEVILTTFGDTMRVPGSKISLLQARANGADIRMVYSPLDCLQIAKNNPEKEVVFFAIGFETTAPANALSVLHAQKAGLTNYSILASHVLVPPAIAAVMNDDQVKILFGYLIDFMCIQVGQRNVGNLLFFNNSGILFQDYR